MIFTEAEMLFFNSMLGGDIFGLRISAPQDADDTYLQDTANSLKQKNMLDKTGEPTALLLFAVKMLEHYKTAERHVFINNTRIALGERKATQICPVNGGYDMAAMDKAALLYGLVMATPYLCGADAGEPETEETIDPNAWGRLITSGDIALLFCVNEFEKQKPTQMTVFYLSAGRGYIYDAAAGVATGCGPRRMRMELAKIFEIEKLKESENVGI